MKPLQKYRVKLAFESYSVGAIIEPTGLWRGDMLARGYIEPYTEPIKPLEQHVIRRRNKPNIAGSAE